MAIYHLRIQVISRGKGQSGVASLAYRSATCLHDERTGETFDFTKKRGVDHVELLLPKDAPEWAKNLAEEVSKNRKQGLQKLSNIIEAHEKRSDSQIYRELEFALPEEFSKEQNIELANQYIQDQCADKGMLTINCFHFDVDKKTGRKKPHCHTLAVTRRMTEDGFGLKEREWNTKKQHTVWRETWAEYLNAALKKMGIETRVDHRSYAELGIDIEPQVKKGVSIKEMVGRGVESFRYALFEDVQRRNLFKIQRRPDLVLELVTKNHSTFTEKDVLKTIGQYADSHAVFEEIRQKVFGLKELVLLEGEEGFVERRGEKGEIIRDKLQGPEDDKVYTTRSMIRLEAELGAKAEALAQRKTHAVAASELEQAKAAGDAEHKEYGGLNAEQKQAIDHIVDEGQFKTLIGYAGSGKTTALKVATQAWQDSGYKVLGLAPTNRAADNLKELGIRAMTIDRYFKSFETGRERYSEKSVFVVDEAGMIHSRQMQALLGVVKELGVKMVAVGDHGQLQPVQAGPPFRMLLDRVAPAKLETIVRQHQPWQRDATKLFGQGHTRLALDLYQQRGDIQSVKEKIPELEIFKEKVFAIASAKLSVSREMFSDQDLIKVYQITRRMAGNVWFQIKSDLLHKGIEEKDHIPLAFKHRDAKIFFRWKGLKESAIQIAERRGLDLEKSTMTLCTPNKRELVDIWLEDYQSDLGAVHVLAAHTDADVGELNYLCRERLRSRGELGEKDILLSVAKKLEEGPKNKKDAAAIDKIEVGFAIGDRIVFRRDDKKLGVKAGEFGILTAVAPDKIKVWRQKPQEAGEQRETATIGEAGHKSAAVKGVDTGNTGAIEQKLEVNLERYPYICHGWALPVTTFRGMKVDYVKELTNLEPYREIAKDKSTFDRWVNRHERSTEGKERARLELRPHLIDLRQGTKQRLAEDFVKDVEKHPDKSHIMLANSNRDVDDLSRMVRTSLKQKGQIATEEVTLRVAKDVEVGISRNDQFPKTKRNYENMAFSVGDQVIFKQNNHGLGVNNGGLGTITHIDKHNVKVKLKGAESREVSFSPKLYPYIRLGWATTIYASQATTVDLVKVLSSFEDVRNLIYVALTRHRNDLKLYVSGIEFEHMDLLKDRLSRTSEKLSGIDYHLEPAELMQVLQDDESFLEKLGEKLEVGKNTYRAGIHFVKGLFREKEIIREEEFGFTRDEAIRAIEVLGLAKYLAEQEQHDPEISVNGRVLVLNEGEKDQRFYDIKTLSELLTKDGLKLASHLLGQTPHKTLSTPGEARYGQTGSLVLRTEGKDAGKWIDFETREQGNLIDLVGREKGLLTTKDRVEYVAKFYGVIAQSNREFLIKGLEFSNRQSRQHDLQRVESEQKVGEVQKAYDASKPVAGTIAETYLRNHVGVKGTIPSSFRYLASHEGEKRPSLAVFVKNDLVDVSAMQVVPLSRKTGKAVKGDTTGRCYGILDEGVLRVDGLFGSVQKKNQQAKVIYAVKGAEAALAVAKKVGGRSETAAVYAVMTEEAVSKVPALSGQKVVICTEEQKGLGLSSSLHSAVAMLEQRGLQVKVIHPVLAGEKLIWKDHGQKKIAGQAQDIQKVGKQQSIPSQKSITEPYESGKTTQGGTERRNQRHKAPPLYDLEAVKDHCKRDGERLATHLLGLTPNKSASSAKEVRYGKKGSFVLTLQGRRAGKWQDFETGEGGDLFALVGREQGISEFKDQLKFVAEFYGLAPTRHNKENVFKSLQNIQKQEAKKQAAAIEEKKERTARLKDVAGLYQQSKPLKGTIAATYLRKARGIQGTLPDDIRFIPKGTSFVYKGKKQTIKYNCMAAVGRNSEGDMLSIQITSLNAEGNRAVTKDGQKLSKLKYGVGTGSFVVLQQSKDDGRVFIAEGVETALSLKEAGVKDKIVVSQGIGNIANYQGVESTIILCADNDGPQSATAKTIEKAAVTLEAKGFIVQTIQPDQKGQDFNDVLLKQGKNKVAEYINAIDLPLSHDTQKKIEDISTPQSEIPSGATQTPAQTTALTSRDKVAEIARTIELLEQRIAESREKEDWDKFDLSHQQRREVMAKLEEDSRHIETLKHNHPETYEKVAHEVEREHSLER